MNTVKCEHNVFVRIRINEGLSTSQTQISCLRVSYRLMVRNGKEGKERLTEGADAEVVDEEVGEAAEAHPRDGRVVRAEDRAEHLRRRAAP